MSNGKFFEKRAKAHGGRFLRDLPGRDDGNFYKAADFGYGQGIGASTSGQMGGSFGVGATASGGGGQYGTGTGNGKRPKLPAKNSQVAKDAVTIMPNGTGKGAEKKAEVQDQHEGHGWHRPTDEQPRALDPSGSRFLQDNHGATDANANVQSGLAGSRMKMRPSASPQMGKHASLRFMGTGFEKRAERGIADSLREHTRGIGGTASSVGSNVLHSANRGGAQAVDWAARTAKNGANTIAHSPALSVLALLGGGVMALKGGKGIAKKILRLGVKERKHVPAGLLARARRTLAG